MKIYRNQFNAGSSVTPRARATRTELSSSNYSHGRNTVRFTPTRHGIIGQVGFAVSLVLVVGLVFLTMTSRITEYDYKMEAMSRQVQELTARKEELAVENARVTSRATINNSDLADLMTRPSTVSHLND
ncbi:hypothetical protein FWH13_03440 [Candidatus Saccharibacteria bacterium]|nr:hypothetical protein [Candidatus Saccharibacteria bacterium]